MSVVDGLSYVGALLCMVMAAMYSFWAFKLRVQRQKPSVAFYLTGVSLGAIVVVVVCSRFYAIYVDHGVEYLRLVIMLDERTTRMHRGFMLNVYKGMALFGGFLGLALLAWYVLKDD